MAHTHHLWRVADVAMRPSIIRRFVVALAIPQIAVVLVSVDTFLVARKTDYLLVRADKASGQMALLDSLSAGLNKVLLDIVLTENRAAADAALITFEHRALHDLGVLDQLTEDEIDFVDQDERLTETEERRRPDLLRSSLYDVVASAKALIDSPPSTDVSANASDRLAAMNAARARFAAMVAEAVLDERQEVSAARTARDRLVSHAMWRSAILLAVALALSVVLAAPLAISLLRRLRGLSAFLTRVVDGQLDVRLTSGRNDELGVLEGCANNMVERLQADVARKAAKERSLADVLQRRMSELELSNARLREVDATRRRLLGDIGHALKTPLAVARGTVENAQTAICQVDGRVDRLDQALLAIDSVVDRIAELLLLARADDGRLVRHETRIELAELLDQVVAKASGLPDAERISLEMEALDPVVIMGEPNELERAFTAILENAMQHGNEEGPIGITLTADNDMARIRVSDGGSGIDESLRPIVFERYVSGRVGGTGIGLSMARQIVQDHGGEIGLNSHAAKGTEIIVTLPLLPNAQVP